MVIGFFSAAVSCGLVALGLAASAPRPCARWRARRGARGSRQHLLRAFAGAASVSPRLERRFAPRQRDLRGARRAPRPSSPALARALARVEAQRLAGRRRRPGRRAGGARVVARAAGSAAPPPRVAQVVGADLAVVRVRLAAPPPGARGPPRCCRPRSSRWPSLELSFAAQPTRSSGEQRRAGEFFHCDLQCLFRLQRQVGEGEARRRSPCRRGTRPSFWPGATANCSSPRISGHSVLPFSISLPM